MEGWKVILFFIFIRKIKEENQKELDKISRVQFLYCTYKKLESPHNFNEHNLFLISKSANFYFHVPKYQVPKFINPISKELGATY